MVLNYIDERQVRILYWCPCDIFLYSKVYIFRHGSSRPASEHWKYFLLIVCLLSLFPVSVDDVVPFAHLFEKFACAFWCGCPFFELESRYDFHMHLVP